MKRLVSPAATVPPAIRRPAPSKHHSFFTYVPPIVGLLLAVCGTAARGADEPSSAESKQTAAAGRVIEEEPAVKIARTTEPDVGHSHEMEALLKTAREKEHPLLPALEYAVQAIRHIEKDIRGYTCLLIKRERIKGRLSNYHFIQAKIRHRQMKDGKVVVPFSVYLKFLKPARYVNREVLYVEGRFHGDLVAKRGGRRNPNLTLRLDPNGPLAMDGNRYPVMEVGFYNLAKRLIEVVKEELEHDDAEVEIFDNAKIDGRPCKRFKVTHPEKKEGLRFHVAEVYVDLEHNIPIYYAAYLWPSKPEGKPRLLEQYIYTKVKINPGLTDDDFDIHNKQYGFRDIDTVPVTGSETETKAPPDDVQETNGEEPEHDSPSSTESKSESDSGQGDSQPQVDGPRVRG